MKKYLKRACLFLYVLNFVFLLILHITGFSFRNDIIPLWLFQTSMLFLGFGWLPFLSFWRSWKRPGRRRMPVMDGRAYEFWCAKYLKKRLKFRSAQVTPKSSDYGADIVGVDMHGVRWVVQCKYYTGSVGVEAVQQVVASMGHYGASRAAVMTNSRLTANAKTLARNNGVAVMENCI